jgi:hypothetical protein
MITVTLDMSRLFADLLAKLAQINLAQIAKTISVLQKYGELNIVL